MATVIVKQKETEKELAKEIKEKRDEGTSWFVPKKKQRVKANPPMSYTARKGNKEKNNNQYDIQTPEKQKKRNRRITVHSTSVQKKVMEQEVTLSAVKGGRDVL